MSSGDCGPMMSSVSPAASARVRSSSWEGPTAGPETLEKFRYPAS